MSLARAAGAAIEALRAAGPDGIEARDKADNSPVTAADLAADRIISQGLRAARPGDAILSEESPWVPGSGEGAVWCVDPIDGTEAYIDPTTRGYAVQIAKLARDPALPEVWRPVLAVVFEPSYDELFAATKGGGLIFEKGGVATPIAPLTQLEHPRLVTSTRAPERLRQALFARGYGDGGKLRSVGVKVGRLLLGEAEIYSAAPYLAYWDLAAPELILEEGGGRVTDLHGNVPAYRFAGGPKSTYFSAPMLLTRGADHARALEDVAAIARTL